MWAYAREFHLSMPLDNPLFITLTMFVMQSLGSFKI
jgi:hypothetical protein